MSWTVELTSDAARTLRKIDPQISRRIRKVLAAIESLEDPRVRGKALTGPLCGLWRYRVGDYLPNVFWRYRVHDWAWYGLPAPPPGCAWVYVDNNIYLVDLFDGYIIDTAYQVWRW